jgi:hypothetical protein
MQTGISKPVILVVISVLVVAVIFWGSSSVSAVTRSPIECGFKNPPSISILQCCQTETDDEGIEMTWCTDCAGEHPGGQGLNCGPRYQALEAQQDGRVIQQPPTAPLLPTTPPFGRLPPGALEDLPTLEQAPTTPLQQQTAPQADQGLVAEPPATLETQPATVEEQPPCPEGQILDEETNLCVLEEPEAVEQQEEEQDEPEQEEQEQEEQEQPQQDETE